MSNLIRFPYKVEPNIYHSKLTQIGSTFVKPTDIRVVSINTDDVYAEIQAKNVSSLAGLFNSMSGLTSLDLSAWNISNYANFYAMFKDCTSLSSLNLAGWKFISQDIDSYNCESMFNGCTHLTNLDLTDWDVQYVTNMAAMFSNCKDLTSVDVADWNVENCEDFDSIFYGCESLTELDLGNWDTYEATNMYGMFAYCKNLRKIWVPSTFVATSVSDAYMKPFGQSTTKSGGTHVYTDAVDASNQDWGTIHSNFTMHYGATHSDYENA